MYRARIAFSSHILPQKIMTNDDLSKIVDTSDEWIFTRTGIRSRHVVADDTTVTSLGIEVAQKLFLENNIDPLSIDAIVVATSTSDQRMPSTAAKIQGAIGALNAFAFDLNAVCAGFVYGLSAANAFIQNGQCKRILVIGAETMTKVLDWNDRTTCVLFGDGAGCVLLERSDDDAGIIDVLLKSDGRRHDIAYCDTTIKMKGPEVYRHAVDKLGRVVEEILQKNNMTSNDVDWFVPHQANLRIIQSLSERFKIPMEKIIITIQEHANTSSASIPIAFDVSKDKIKRGEVVLFEAIGYGLVWGSVLLKY